MSSGLSAVGALEGRDGRIESKGRLDVSAWRRSVCVYGDGNELSGRTTRCQREAIRRDRLAPCRRKRKSVGPELT
jgi:hypothetical protein